jgi:tRNA 2-thiouridine synthesizing protein A
MPDPDQTLNCEGLNCPMPIVKIAKTIKTMSSGETLEVTATDPAFQADLNAWSKKTKNPIIEFSAEDVLRALIQKG